MPADATPDDAREIEQGRGLDRVIAFSDGVFAIAITLLVLNFKLPEVSGGDLDRKLFDAVADDWGLWFSYALSFAIIARFWVVHHRLSMLLRRIDPRFLVLNLVLLAFVVVLPYPTEILGEYGNSTAVAIYAATMALTGFASAALWHYAVRAGLMDTRIDALWTRHSLLRGLSVPIVFLVSIPFAFVSTTIAELMWFGLFFTHLFFRHRFGSIHQPYGTTDA
jgi:TMEM175 potassium channel family protein